MTEITTMSQKGQVVIPQKIRKNLKLKQGTRLLVYAKNGLVMMQPFELPLEPPKREMHFLDLYNKPKK
jgi:AbrB family looped-hinge helix DNA binding protein